MMTQVAAILRRIKRDSIALIMLYLSWPVCLVHRFWNNAPPHKGSWFIIPVYRPDGTLLERDIQYYICDSGNMISNSLILFSILILKKKTTDYLIAVTTIALISIIDFYHYWLCYKQNEFIVTLEGLGMLLAASITLLRKWARI